MIEFNANLRAGAIHGKISAPGEQARRGALRHVQPTRAQSHAGQQRGAESCAYELQGPKTRAY